MVTLYDPTVERVLSRLYAEASETDHRQMELEREAAAAASENGQLYKETLASIQDRAFMAVAPEVGRPLNLLYLDYVRDQANGYVSCKIPLDDGIELSIR